MLLGNLKVQVVLEDILIPLKDKKKLEKMNFQLLVHYTFLKVS